MQRIKKLSKKNQNKKNHM